MDRIIARIEQAAREAGEIILSAHGNDLGVENKEGRANFVTRYDKKVQEFLTGRLREIIPEARFLGEENGMDEFLPGEEKGYLFVIDPIDGTTNFIHNVHPHVTSIGLLKDGQPWAGVVYAPVTGQMFSAQRGEGAWENGKRIRSSKRPLSENIVVTGSAGFSLDAFSVNQKLAYELQSKCQGVRSTGSAEYNLCMVASGRFGGYFEMKLGLWDFAAGSVILEEAGGRITDYRGELLTWRGGSSVAAVCEGMIGDENMPDTAAYLEMWNGK